MNYEPTAADYTRGYWYHRHGDEFPPSPTFHLEESFAGCSLRLAEVPEQPRLSDYRVKKVIQGWADILPHLKEVEMLWFAPKVNQSLFEAICKMPNLKGLHIKQSSIKIINPDPLQNLKFLHLGSSPSLESVEPVAQLENLEWLDTENLKLITNFSPISKLSSLSGLSIDGSMWKTQRINTLAPLASLTNLRYLSLTNTRAIDDSLHHLHGLKKLETLNLAKWWPDQEVNALRKAKPSLNLI